jgi:hypothetical protein
VSDTAARLALILAIAGLLPAALALSRWPGERRLPPGPGAVVEAGPPEPPSGPTLDSTASAVAMQAPFRRSRRQARAAYDPSVSDAPVAVAEPAVAKPALVLAGFALGDRPIAVLEGVPGFDGPLVLAEGESAAGVRIRRVRQGGVVVVGYDTLWTLVLKEPWR